MPAYNIPVHNARLFILFHCEEDNISSPECRLVDYALHGPSDMPNLSEALLYVWSCAEKPISFSISTLAVNGAAMTVEQCPSRRTEDLKVAENYAGAYTEDM